METLKTMNMLCNHCNCIDLPTVFEVFFILHRWTYFFLSGTLIPFAHACLCFILQGSSEVVVGNFGPNPFGSGRGSGGVCGCGVCVCGGVCGGGICGGVWFFSEVGFMIND